MKYLAVLIWSILLLEMIGFVLSSLDGGGGLNLILPIIMSVVLTIFIALFDLVIKPNHQVTDERETH